MADPELKAKVEELIGANQVLLFMKGTPDDAALRLLDARRRVLDQLGVEYGAIDVLPALQPLREVTAEISDWQTFPQLYVNGELLGGCRHRRGDVRVRRAGRGARRRAAGEAAAAPAPAERPPAQSPPLQIDSSSAAR